MKKNKNYLQRYNKKKQQSEFKIQLNQNWNPFQDKSLFKQVLNYKSKILNNF